MAYTSIRPGEIWLDTNGKRIQAHGGSILYWEDTYYWYGENKEFTIPDREIWHWGVRCYSSKDLYNWKDEGIIIKPDLEDKTSVLHPFSCMDRPHIIYNQQTKKFVCWLKIMEKDKRQTETILMADQLLGPYTMVKSGLQPLHMNAGDFDLVVDPRDGKAYYYFERVHSEMICADLTDDYTGVTGFYSTHFPRKCPPHVREAVAHFTYQRKHYLITSGTTGYFPNPSEVSRGLSYHGPFTVLGNPHRKDMSQTSFHSQITSVFQVPGKKNLYIALADRWLPQMQHIQYPEIARAYEAMFDTEITDIPYIPEMHQYYNTSIADYVWLPLHFEGEMVYIDWLEEWRIEDYE